MNDEDCVNSLDLLLRLREAAPAGVIERVHTTRTAGEAADATLYLRAARDPGGAVSTAVATHDAVAWARPVDGRVEVRLADEALARMERAVRAGTAPTPRVPSTFEPRCVVKFFDPNATKPVHVGHVRTIALGNALATLFAAAGVDVTRISAVCDTGRCAAEAVAGYRRHHHGETPTATGVSGDVFVGRCYRDYARQAASTSSGPDRDAAPRPGDLADWLMPDLHRPGTTVAADWSRLRRWVLEGHERTLRRLAVPAPIPYFESQVIERAAVLADVAHRRGVLRTASNGALELPGADTVGRAIAMRRADGSMTGYMRHFAIWSDLQSLHAPPVGCVNVVGDEWIPYAQAREALLARLHPCPLYDGLRTVGVGMVRLDGETMKSREGPVMLADDCVDAVADALVERGVAAHVAGAEPLAAVVVKCFFLNVPASKPMDFSLARMLEERASPGWALVRAWVRAHGAGGSASPDPAERRLLILRTLELEPIWELALRTCDVRPILTHLRHIAARYLGVPGAGPDALVASILRRGMSSIGVLPAEAEP